MEKSVPAQLQVTPIIYASSIMGTRNKVDPHLQLIQSNISIYFKLKMRLKSPLRLNETVAEASKTKTIKLKRLKNP